MAIVAAGAIVNIIFAIIVYFILSVSSGSYITNEITKIEENYPAYEIGLQKGDKITKINNNNVNNVYEINRALQGNKEEITLEVERNGRIQNYVTKPKEIKEGEYSSYYLGVNLKIAEDNIQNRLYNGIITTKEFLLSIGDSLKQLFTGKVGVDQMVGPVGISEVVSKTDGIKEFVSMLALISISLGITNLLPIPALDGGKLLILLIECIRRKPMKEQTEINIQLLGFAILIGLSIYVTYNDIIRIF